MGTKFEKKFKIEDVLKKDNDYHVWVISFAAARQDLYFVNKNIIRILEGENDSALFYYVKMNVGHLNESFKLLIKAFDSNIKNELLSIPSFKDNYDDLLDFTNGSDDASFYKSILFDARNNSFHYNNGNWNKTKKKYDFDNTKQVLQLMYDERHFSGYKIGEKEGENDFYFADEIQMNWLFELGKNMD